MNNLKSQRGQALVLIALAAVVLFGFAALAIDSSRVYSDKRHAQNAADTSAIAAALAKIRQQDYAAAALSRAANNGYANDSDSTVTVNLCSDNGVICLGLPATANKSEFIRVQITSQVPMTLGRVVGWQFMTNDVEAIARAKGTFSSTPSTGFAMLAYAQTGCGICANGNVMLDINGGGIFSNSTSSSGDCSIDFEGNGTYTSDGGYSVAPGGAACQSGNVSITPGLPATTGVALAYPPAFNYPEPSFSCSGNGGVTGTTITPGVFNSHLELSGNGNYTFTGGNYCFNNGVTINGNITATANNVNFRINASSFQINGNSKLICSNMLVHGVGGTGIEFNGNATNHCTGVTFYMKVGKVVWNGNVAQQFSAPTSGDYKGILIYLPYPNNSALTINGNSGNQITGSIIAPAAPITINGNSGTSGLNTQIMGYTITLNGNSNTTINYTPAGDPGNSSLPTIELTK